MSIPESLIEPLWRVLDWMVSHDRGDGALICGKHKVEHTGKSAGAIVIACELARLGASDRERLFSIALAQSQRLVLRLEREDSSTCFTFRPGRHDPFNCSNSVIDGGACSDALATMLEVFGSRLTFHERESIQHACVLHAQTYLRYAVMDKPIPAQRAWAMTGVAGGWRMSGHEVLELTVREGSKGLAQSQHADGSYPYHPVSGGAPHPGCEDVSSYYQGRVTAFLIHSLEGVGLDPAQGEHGMAVRSGLDFLCGLYGPDGLKCGLVEAKPWYWSESPEVASHAFDVYALSRGWRIFGDANYGHAALLSWRSWLSRLDDQGQPHAHFQRQDSRTSYQCSMFWAGHASWLARALPDLEALLGLDSSGALGSDCGESPRMKVFAEAGLVRLENAGIVAWIRTARPGRDGMNGSPYGAGMVRVLSKATGTDCLHRPMDGAPFGTPPVGEWCGRGKRQGLRASFSAGADALRFSLWLARCAWRSGRFRAALTEPFQRLRENVLSPAAGNVRSCFDLAPQYTLRESGVELLGCLAYQDGTPMAHTRVRRRYDLDDLGLVVTDEILEGGSASHLTYSVPLGAVDVQQDALRVHYRIT